MTITLEIDSISLVIKPSDKSTRSLINWLKTGQPTARGVTTVQGITARTGLFAWDIKARLFNYDFLKLQRIINTQQERLATNSANATIQLSDRIWYVDSISAAKTGRTELSTITVNSEVGKFCQFNVYATIVENSALSYQNYKGLNSTEEFSLMLSEF